MSETNHKLAIVVPYYKRRYLEAVLESLACQTDQHFGVFIGDDESPEDPKEIIKKYQCRLQIEYRRFPNNLGRHSLVAQWNRCVRETSSEWVWLFADDDVASPNCIAEFYKVLAETGGGFDLYRFRVKIMNATGQIIHDPPKHPLEETEKQFLFAKFTDMRTSCAIEYIFRRNTFEMANGFVDFPLAWCSDDASWMAFSRRTGIRTIQNADVFWRMSELNISAINPKLVGIKLNAFREYLLWLLQEFPDAAIQKKLRGEVGKWFPDQIKFWGGNPNFVAGIKFWFFFSRYTGRTDFDFLRRLMNVPRVRGVGRLKRILLGKSTAPKGSL